MSKNRDASSVLEFLAFVGLVILVTLLGRALQREQTQNILLKSEVHRWQMASVPALKARGWKLTQEEMDVLDPTTLEIALNPCIDKDGSWIGSQECLSAMPPPYNPNKLTIKIIPAR